MTKDRVRRGRFRIAKWALVGGVALLAGAIAIALALAQLRPTQMAGRIAVTADRFVDLGGGLTLATGNIQLGDKLEMAGEDAQVLFNSHTLTGRGTLVMAEDNTPLLSGEFNADVASGVATPASGSSSKLARVAGFAVSKPAEIEKIDIPNGTATGMAVIHIAGPSQVATSTVNFMLSPELLFSGVLPPLDFELGGVRLQAPGGAALANGMISIPQVSVTFPPEYGGGTATINDFRVAADGVSVAGADGTFEAPEMIWGENSEFRLMNAKGRFVYDGTVFSILTDLSGDLAINVPGLAENVKASVALSTIDGQVALVGKTEPLNLMLGGVALQTGPLALVAEGLSTANATLVFPPEMSGMSVAVSDVMITAEGLSVGGGSFALPEIQLADGMLTLSGAKAQVTPVDGVYMVAAEGTLNMMLPGAQEPATVSFMVDSNGALQGVAKGIKIDLGGPQIVLGEAQIGANGLTASGAMFVLPPELGGISGMVDVVNITAEGLDFGAAGLNLLLPDLPMGEAMNFTNNTAELKVVRSVEVDQYMLAVNSTLNIAAAGQVNQEAVQFTMSTGSDGSFEMNGNVSGLALDLGGLMLNARNLAITTEGLAVGEATLAFSPDWGGGTIAVQDVTIGAEGIAFNGGAAIAMPDMVLGGEFVTLSGLKASIRAADGQYMTSAQGTLTIALPDNMLSTSIDLAMGEAGDISAKVNGIALNIAGVTLDLGEATLTSDGVYATAATFKLPAELGGVEGMVGKVSITEAGLDFDAAQLAIPLPDIPMGDAMTFMNNTAKLSTVRSSEADKFILDVSSTLNLNVAGSLTQQPVQFTMSTGSDGSFEMNGNIGGLVVDLGGVMVALKDVAITSTGLGVSEASVVLPAELGGATAKVTDVSIGADGLAIGGGIFSLPELQLADGNIVISGVLAELVPVNGEWTLAAQGTVQIALGGSPAALVTFTLGSDGSLKGMAKNLSLDLGVAVLALGDATLSNEGLTAANASFTVPALFGLSGKVDTASITAEGLSFGTAELSVALPDLSFGDYGFAKNTAKLTASTMADGPMYLVSIETTMVSNIAGTMQERPLRLVLTPSASPEAVAKMGSVNGLMVNLNGVTVLFEGLTPQ